MTDRQLSAIAYDLRDDLGDWLKRRQKNGIEDQGNKARKIINECGVPEPVLRAQWELQKAAQLSIRARRYSNLR